jgi:polar amino acid transport system ATP-binding protein
LKNRIVEASPTDPEVIYREKDLMVHRRSVGTVFQAFNLFPTQLPCRTSLFLEQVHQQTACCPPVRRDLERFQLSEHSTNPAPIVRGQRQRGYWCAISIKPKLLLLMNRLALDPEMTAEV